MDKKVLIVTDNLKDQVNGVAVTFKNLEKEALKDNHTFYFVDPSSFKHFDAPGYPEVKLSIPLGINKLIEEINPDYIHIATEGPLGLAARLYCFMNSYKYNTSYHTRFPEFLKEIYHIPQWITYTFLKWFHKDSQVVLTNTDSMVQLLKRKNFKCNIKKWGRGVDLSNLKPNVKDEQDGTVLYVGRVSKEKNLEELLELENDFDIVIVGDGPHRNVLEAKYKKVKFVGYKHGTELANYYRKASVFAFPSKSDTFGMVIIEAMSQGCPVASFPAIGPRDIIENHVTGVMSLDLKEAIIEAKELNRESIKKRAKDWTWKKSWQEFKENLVQK